MKKIRHDKASKLHYNTSNMKRLREFLVLASSLLMFVSSGCGGGGGVGGTESKLTGQWVAEKLNAKGDRILLVFNEGQASSPSSTYGGPDASAQPSKGGKTVRIVAIRPAGDAYSVDEGDYSIKDSRLYFNLSAVDDFNSPYTITAGTTGKPGVLTLGSEVYFQVVSDPTAGPQLGGQIQISQAAADEAVTTGTSGPTGTTGATGSTGATGALTLKSNGTHYTAEPTRPSFVLGELIRMNNNETAVEGPQSALSLSEASAGGGGVVPPFSIVRVSVDEEVPSSKQAQSAALTVVGGAAFNKLGDLVAARTSHHDLLMAATLKALEACKAEGKYKCALNPIVTVQSLSAPTDTYYSEQWNLDAMSTTDAWGIVGTAPAKQTIVAVIDTGIRPNPDLDDHILKKADGTYWGVDMVHKAIDGIPNLSLDGDGVDGDPTDPGDQKPLLPEGSSWHGTHIAGIIAADIDNGAGIAGIATNVKIMPLRAMGYKGDGTLADVAQAIYYAAGLPNVAECGPFNEVDSSGGSYSFDAATWVCHPDGHPKADIINLSLGGAMNATAADVLNKAINDATAAGLLVVTAAGNDAKEPGWCADPTTGALYKDPTCSFYPAANPHVMAVSAIYANFNFASAYSNFGVDGNNPIDIAAPGGSGAQGILSTVHPSSYGKYGMLTGTSQAAAHVSGVAALVWSEHPEAGFTNESVRTAILTSAIDLGNPGVDNYFGAGLINACGAVAKARQMAGMPLPAGASALKVSTGNVDFSSLGNTQTVLITGGCGSAVAITKVSKTSSTAWLDVKYTSVSTPAQLQLAVKRDGLATGDYAATVTVESAAGNQTVAIAMKVGNTSVAGDGGLENQINNFLKNGTTDAIVNTTDLGEVVLLLIDADTGDAKYYTKTDLTADYRFQFAGFAPGKYYLLGGADDNGDGKICVAGEKEPCFSYPNLADPQPFDIKADTKNNTVVIPF